MPKCQGNYCAHCTKGFKVNSKGLSPGLGTLSSTMAEGGAGISTGDVEITERDTPEYLLSSRISCLLSRIGFDNSRKRTK